MDMPCVWDLALQAFCLALNHRKCDGLEYNHVISQLVPQRSFCHDAHVALTTHDCGRKGSCFFRNLVNNLNGFDREHIMISSLHPAASQSLLPVLLAIAPCLAAE